jgi:hypothetical protein
MELLNSSPHISTMCYLYTTLHAKGAFLLDKFGFETSDKVKRDRMSENAPHSLNLVMHDIEIICRWHGTDIFGILDFSNQTANIANTMRVRAGSIRSWIVDTAKTVVLLLLAYLHSKITFWQMLGRSDRKMTERLPLSERQSYSRLAPYSSWPLFNNISRSSSSVYLSTTQPFIAPAKLCSRRCNSGWAMLLKERNINRALMTGNHTPSTRLTLHMPY